MLLNEVLGTKTPSGCFALSRNSMEDNFTVPGANKFEGDDDIKHRNSWLMPKMARRMTRNNKYHVSQWRQNPTVDSSECDRLRASLTEKVGAEEVNALLPRACQNV